MMHFCSLYSGSSGNALFVSAGGTKILVDAGLSCKRIFSALDSIGENPTDISAIFISHEHIDHVRGAGIISRKLNIPIFANENTWARMIPLVGSVSPENIMIFKTGEHLQHGGIKIHPFSIPHDAAEPVGFNFFANGKKLTIATDIGHVNDEILGHVDGSDLILLESNHDLEMLRIGPYPYYLKRRIEGKHGHLSNDTASEIVVFLAERGTCRFILGHLSKENNFPELAYLTMQNKLQTKNLVIGKDIIVEIACRDSVGRLLKV
ncbi:MAG: MBL fold metallo-hydrolase [Clostridia bacterium]